MYLENQDDFRLSPPVPKLPVSVKIQNGEFSFCNINKLSSFLVTVLGTLYLVFILTGVIDKEKRRFETPEIIIFSIIVILNSDFIEQLKKLSISKEGFTLEKEVKEQVAKTKGSFTGQYLKKIL